MAMPGRGREIIARIGLSRGQGEPLINCEVCGQIGHTSKYCRLAIFCDNCKNPGHEAADCNSLIKPGVDDQDNDIMNDMRNLTTSPRHITKDMPKQQDDHVHEDHFGKIQSLHMRKDPSPRIMTETSEQMRSVPTSVKSDLVSPTSTTTPMKNKWSSHRYQSNRDWFSGSLVVTADEYAASNQKSSRCRPRAHGYCYICGDKSHYANQCPKRVPGLRAAVTGNFVNCEGSDDSFSRKYNNPAQNSSHCEDSMKLVSARQQPSRQSNSSISQDSYATSVGRRVSGRLPLKVYQASDLSTKFFLEVPVRLSRDLVSRDIYHMMPNTTFTSCRSDDLVKVVNSFCNAGIGGKIYYGVDISGRVFGIEGSSETRQDFVEMVSEVFQEQLADFVDAVDDGANSGYSLRMYPVYVSPLNEDLLPNRKVVCVSINAAFLEHLNQYRLQLVHSGGTVVPFYCRLGVFNRHDGNIIQHDVK